MGLARILQADFVAVHTREILAAINALEAESRSRRSVEAIVPSVEVAEEDHRSISEIVQSGSEQASSSNNFRIAFYNRPLTTTLKYIEHSISVLEDASPKRVVYIHGDPAIFQVTMSGSWQSQFVEMLLLKKAYDPGTLFILSEGSRYDPSGNDSDGGRSSLSEVRSLLDSSNGLLRKSRDSESFSSFSWMIDSKLNAPRIVITPPEDPKASASHRKQITMDFSLHIFTGNYNSILKRFAEFSTSESLFNELVTSLPLIEAGTSPDVIKNIRNLLPSLNGRQLSPQEITAFCLSLSLDSPQLTSDPFGFFVQSIDKFVKLRELQERAVGLLSGNGFGQISEVNQEDLNKYERRFVSNIVSPSMVGTRFEDIGALDKVKRTLYELISLRLERPDYFTKGILKDNVSGILLFGPPGTGKTMLAKAVAAQSGANFISVSSSSIFDMYVGEGEKNVKVISKS
jgi:hypothetical protein